MGHTGTADGLDQRFFDDPFFHIEGEFAGTLLWGAPAHSMGEPADIAYLSGFGPCTFLGNRGRTMIRPLGHAAHFLDFRRVLHSCLLGKLFVLLMIFVMRVSFRSFCLSGGMHLPLQPPYYSRIVTNYKSWKEQGDVSLSGPNDPDKDFFVSF
jgi:hypothetical protein